MMMMGEIRFAVRRLLRRPGFAVMTIGTLALGLGATTALFSVVDGVLLKPLPYDEPDRLVFLGHQSETDLLGMPDGGFFHYGERSRTLEQLALYIEVSSPIAGGDSPLELGIIQASHSLLPMLGVAPTLGRGFVDDDHEPGAAPVAVISHAFWSNNLGGDPAVLGKPITPGSTTAVIGVLPEGFEFKRPEAIVMFGNRFEAPDAFVPLERLDQTRARFGNFMYHSLGRLAPGATAEDAQAELAGLMVEAAEVYPEGLSPASIAEGNYRPLVMELQDFLTRDISAVLWILMGACFLVLAIATANVTNLFLVRADSRQSEIDIRRALGASRRSVAWAYFSESAVVATVGGVLGLAVAAIGTRALLETAPASLPGLSSIRFDPRVMSFAAVATGLTAFGVGAVPFFRSGTGKGGQNLARGERAGTTGVERHRVRRGLLIGQVALAAVLLTGSTLLVRTFQNLQDVDPGFDGSRTATMRLSLSGSILQAAGRTESASDMARSRFMLDVKDRLQALPGVEQASFSADLPLDGDQWHDYVVTEDYIPPSNAEAVRAGRVFVGPDYFDAIGARVAQGRELSDNDFADQPRVAVVNQAFAEERWPDQTAVGRRIAQFYPGIDAEQDAWYTVVGVVEDIRETSLMISPEPTVYLPTAFIPGSHYSMWISNMVAVVRVSGDPEAMTPQIRSEILAYRSDVPINNVATLPQITVQSFLEVSFAMRLISIAAAVSMFLGAIGIYGAVSYVVGQRTREFGVRMALGAPSSHVRKLVLAQGGWVGALGVSVGIFASFLAMRLLESLLFGVRPFEFGLYLAVAVGLMAVVMGASLIPAMRAAHIDPALAMQSE